MTYQITELQRRLSNVIRIGTITEVDADKATAKVELAENLITRLIPWTAPAGTLKAWSCPAVGEQVIVISPNGNLDQGLIIGGLFSNANSVPETDATIHEFKFRDGTTISYDTENKKLVADVGTGTADITAALVTIHGDLQVNGAISSTGDITSDSDVIASDGITQLTHKHPETGNVTGVPQ